MNRREVLLRRRIKEAVMDETGAGADYAETAVLARDLGYESVARAFEDAAEDERRHRGTFSGLLDDMGQTVSRGVTMRDL